MLLEDNELRDDFQRLREMLTAGQSPDAASFAVPCYRRLASVLSSSASSPHDLAVLLRHVLRHETERQGGHAQTLSVPVSERWLPVTEWERFGIQASGSGGKLTLTARRWLPSWSEEESVEPLSPEVAAFAEAPRRHLEAVEGDPFLTALGRDTYRCAGQKQAVRAVLTMPPGATLIVNLPTGSGKSLCAHILGKMPFLGEDEGGLTVVVVPTTALCLDQERALKDIVPPPTAYFGGMNEVKRRELWGRVAAGTQHIVFTSPESVMGSLRPAIYAALRRGALRALVVDEAHIVEQWGNGFRSAFQELAGLRRALLREAQSCGVAAPRTVLLSATLTESSLSTLETLFGEVEPPKMVSAVQLRPEPSLWLVPCRAKWLRDAHALQEARVLEALHHLPRPLILYTTKVESAVAWEARLKTAGFKRLACMTGDTPAEKRERIVTAWAQAKLDMVVATSAFGLGIDQSDVRAVVHACVPETVDRLYQEIGRGGRDGNASISLVIYTQADNAYKGNDKDDFSLGASMNLEPVISVSRGLERWSRMFATKTALGGGRFRLKLDVSPGLSIEDIDMVSGRNEDWNARTLTLLSRAGMLALDDEVPPLTENPTPQAGETVSTQWTPTRVVHILDHDHLSEKRWEEVVEPARERTEKAQRRQWTLMRELLAQKTCASQVLARAYQIENLGKALKAPVAPSCGGCGWCRQQGAVPFSHTAPPSRLPWPAYLPVGPRLMTYLRGSSLLAIFTAANATASEQKQNARKLLRWMIGQGVASIAAPPEMLAEFRDKEAAALQIKPIFVAETYRPRDLPRVPTLLFHPIGEPLAHLDSWLRHSTHDGSYEPLILVLPDNAAPPDHRDRRLMDVAVFPHLRYAEWAQREAQ